MTERSLPARLQDAQAQHAARIFDGISHREAVHVVRFFFRHDDGQEQDVAEFVAPGYMYVPSEGEKITLHDVPVTATRVEVTYDATKDGYPAILADVAIVRFEET